ncbi:M4 family metallopeptidase [Bacteroidota bacterium]
MRNLKRVKVLIIVSMCLIHITKAQDQSIIELQVKGKDSIPMFIIFKNVDKSFSKGKEKDVFKEYLKTNGNDEMKKVRTKNDELGFTHERYEQFYKGVKVESAIYNVHIKDGKIESINGNFKRIGNININSKISEETALQKALDYIGANVYMWEIPEMEEWIKRVKNDPNATLYPKSELVIVENRYGNREMRLAYKFNIYAYDPFSNDNIYVDANNAGILNAEALIKYNAAPGIADTRYSGQKEILTDSYNGTYRLRDYTRGNGIEIFNMNNSLGFNNITDFEDNDNNWTDTEWNNLHKDNAALDALWAAQKTYDYFWETFGRNSFDDLGTAIKGYIHWGNNYDRAAWDPTANQFYFGDGGSKYDALTAIDVVAHEIGHAICDNTAELSIYDEPGALDEGLSDIWGACVEHFADPEKETWLQGEDIRLNDICTRSLINPSSLRNTHPDFYPLKYPDTYKGIGWYTGDANYGGRNHNCTVIGHWFYLLSQGGTGTNDNGDYFNVSGIGIENAAKIVYRLETSNYLNVDASFYNARFAALKSARDKFGFNSNQVIQTGKAWYAVGVGELDFLPVITDSQIRGGSDYVAFNSVNTFYITPVTDTLTTSYSWSIIPYSMSCSSDKLPYFIGSSTGTQVRIKHGSCPGTYLLRCVAKNYWSSSYYQDRVITVYDPNGGGGNPGDPDPCDPVMSMYPNPGKKTEVTILKIQQPPPGDDPCDEYPEAYSQSEYEIKLYDLSGNVVFIDTFISDTYTFKNANFKSGIYVVTIKDKKGKVHQKRLNIK